jgi:hypothetical protein
VRKETQHNLFQFTCYLNTYVLQWLKSCLRYMP